MPLLIEPQLATLVERHPTNGDWSYEIKFDGYRMLSRLENAAEWVREAERETKLVDALYKARHLISMHNGMTVRCDGEEWALNFKPELQYIDATLQSVGVDTRRQKQ
ncbi:ATP-dependent DNA ligase [Paraburkholderia sp. RAU6.4a]|uniref:hypothetical protein n=1 Tax=Paraburkholderia sp. RAU6.4a TaxID=2991067 RepID=UPI003D1CC67B